MAGMPRMSNLPPLEPRLREMKNRMTMKRQNPGPFTVVTGLEVAGEQCMAVGNRFLLDIPDKMAVVVHRRYTDE